jgi:23S rRNA pseudouridine2605 synthase
MVRLQKIVADSGLCSRRKAEALISEGRVTVNGKVAKLGDGADLATDRVEVDGTPIFSEKKVYFLLNKPPGYECSLRSTSGKPLAVSLVNTKFRIFPVGRLDADSRGLLILTNDGDFSNRITHPSSSVDKEYIVEVSGRVPDAALERLRAGVILDGTRTRPCQIETVDRTGSVTVLKFVIHEGRKRQIRRMLELEGFKVKDLKRTRIGCVVLKRLIEGCYRTLTESEVRCLLEIAGSDS